MIISYSFDKMSWVNKLFIVLLCTLNNLASHRFRYHQRVCCFWSHGQEQTPVMRPRLIIWLTFQMTDHRARYGEAWESPEDGEICFLGNMTSFVVWSFGYGMTFCSCYNIRCSNVMSRFLSVLRVSCFLTVLGVVQPGARITTPPSSLRVFWRLFALYWMAVKM